jgi:hypothetical protein
MPKKAFLRFIAGTLDGSEFQPGSIFVIYIYNYTY